MNTLYDYSALIRQTLTRICRSQTIFWDAGYQLYTSLEGHADPPLGPPMWVFREVVLKSEVIVHYVLLIGICCGFPQYFLRVVNYRHNQHISWLNYVLQYIKHGRYICVTKEGHTFTWICETEKLPMSACMITLSFVPSSIEGEDVDELNQCLPD